MREAFDAAADLPPDARAAYIDGACADDPALRAEVESLLAADASAQSFLDPGPGLTAETVAPALPARIGRYRIIRLIGAGGMGSVYEAVQENPRRTVALKVMRPGIAAPSALRRFEYETQVLARLHHPGIAQIFEAGTHRLSAPDGDGPSVPYFAMEFVPGAKPITDYAAAGGLSVRRRLDLLASVCDAVHHGHQNGVIHRDLKPANILVDASGQPKVIDFGVARATDSDVTAATIQTGAGLLIGTLRYMSPEQCDVGGGGDGPRQPVDTRSDVYSLGVVLFELLTGTLPYDLSSASLTQAPGVICTATPRRPSSIDPALRGDVETIILKSLEKGRDRRYSSAAELAADIRRFLAHQPISARPPSAVYQVRMFARRNRALVGAIAAAFLVLALGVAATGLSLVRAIRERDEKETARATAQAVSDLVRQMLSSANPNEGRGKDYTVRELLDTFAAGLSDRLEGQPAVEATMRSTMGDAYRALGEFALSEAQSRRELELTIALHGRASAGAALAMSNLAQSLDEQARFEESDALHEEAIRVMRALPGREPKDLANLLTNHSAGLMYRREIARCEALNREALEILRSAGSGNEFTVALAATGLGVCLNQMGRNDEAAALQREALATFRRLRGDRNPETAVLECNLAATLRDLGRVDEADELYSHAILIQREVLGEGHSDLANTLNNLGYLRQQRGDFAGAEPLYRECIAIVRRTRGDRHPYVAIATQNLVQTLRAQGKSDEADALERQASRPP